MKVCRYNKHVDCNSQKNCWSCGWNPEVDKERKKNYTITHKTDLIIAELKRENRELRKLIMRLNKDPKVHPLIVHWIE